MDFIIFLIIYRNSGFRTEQLLSICSADSGKSKISLFDWILICCTAAGRIYLVMILFLQSAGEQVREGLLTFVTIRLPHVSQFVISRPYVLGTSAYISRKVIIHS